MKRISFLFLIVTCLFSARDTAAEDETARNWEDYPDFTALRREIGWSEDFDERCGFNETAGEMVSLMNGGKWTQAVTAGLAWLESCPIDIRIHYYTWISYSEAGQERKGKVHFEWVMGLMESVLATGDGKSAESPLVTISVQEEYDVLLVLDLEPKKQE